MSAKALATEDASPPQFRPHPKRFISWAALGRAQTFEHSDDTTMRVQSLRKEIAGQAEAPAQRTGIFTTNIIAPVDQRRVALFFVLLRQACGAEKIPADRFGGDLKVRAVVAAQPAGDWARARV